MSREYPDWVNPNKAAAGGRIYRGTVPLARMQRLAPLLAASGGEVGFRAAFSLDSQGRVLVRIEVEAELPLTCQVTLETYRHPVVRQSLLAVVGEASEQEFLPDDYEPTCVEAGRLVLAGLVEDELLLALPQVPRKPGLEHGAFSTDPAGPDSAAAGREGHHRPFAALEGMLGEGRKDSKPD